MEDAYKESFAGALRAAQERLEELVARRQTIDLEIMAMKRVVESLSTVAGEPSEDLPDDIEVTIVGRTSPPMKRTFTNSIRGILAKEGDYLTAPQIRDELLKRGFDMSKYSQELVPVHNVLKRLESQGEVRVFRNESGQSVAYQLIPPVERAHKNQMEINSLLTVASLIRDEERKKE